MKKIMIICFLLVIASIAVSCDAIDDIINNGLEQGTDQGSVDTITENPDDSKILIAYFSWADNVEEFDINDLTVDSYTGASLTNPGNAEIVANFIHGEIGGTLHKIIVTEPYSPVYNDCLSRASQELSSNSRPQLKTTVEDFDSYDYIFLGFPNWWNQAPRAVLTFIDSYNFENKTVIPFCMHGTSGKNRPVNEVSAYLPDTTTVVTSLGVYRPETLSSQDNVIEWLNNIGFIENEQEISTNN